ncbi:MAG: MBL fold metallo-hydrolase [Phycisphaerae bacterium]|nr:MBL fold metallo-hydrolase [Phycisphaerae bacterium]
MKTLPTRCLITTCLTTVCLFTILAAPSRAGESGETMTTKTTTQPTSQPAAEINVAVEKTSEGDLTLQPINRSSVRFEFKGKQYYVDPSGEADWDRMPKADIIFVTHEHGDHLDLAVIRTITKKDTVVYTSAASLKKVQESQAKEEEAKSAPKLPKFGLIQVGETKEFGDITVSAMPAYNVSEERKNFHPKSRQDNGYVLTFGDKRVYVAGDTEETPEMKALKDIDIAFLPCDPRYTMSVKEAAEAARTLQPKIFYPYHQGPSDPNEVKDLLKDEKNIEVRVFPLP